jgi:hypothetical protein
MSVKQLREECINTLKKIPDNASEREIGYTIAIIHLIKIIDEKYSKLLIPEMSDEQIFNAAKESRLEDLITSVGSFELGAQWYREQIKKLL